MPREHLPNLSGELPFRVERTGLRDLTLSGAVSYVAGARHLDLDMYQYCPRCCGVEACMEAVGGTSGKYAYMTRAIAQKLGVPALLVRHAKNDTEFVQPVEVRYIDSQMSRLPIASWGDLVTHLEEIHEGHRCS